MLSLFGEVVRKGDSSSVTVSGLQCSYLFIDVVLILVPMWFEFPILICSVLQSRISGRLNRWRRKYKDFIKSFDIPLKTIVLKQYRGIRSQVNFASFFLLNARELESMRLEVGASDCNEAFFAEQYAMLQMEKRASRGARLHFIKKLCTHPMYVDHVRELSVADPFECRC
jgi:hypothetical protein